MTETAFLDTSSLRRLYESDGVAGLDRLLRDPDRTIVVTSIVADEITESTNVAFAQDFDDWLTLNSNQPGSQVRQINVPISTLNEVGYINGASAPIDFAVGNGTGAGEYSIRYLLEGRDPTFASELMGDDVIVRVVIDEAPAFNRINNGTVSPSGDVWPSPDAVSPSAELSAIDYNNGRLDANAYNIEIGQYLDHLEQTNAFRTSWAVEIRSAIGDAAAVDAVVEAIEAVDTGGTGRVTKILSTAVAATGLEALGVFGDVYAYAATSVVAQDLLQAGDTDGASRTWAVYYFETGGGIAGASAGVYLGSGGGFWGSLGGAVLGSVAGAVGGGTFGGWLYDHNPDAFNEIIGGRLNEHQITIGDGVNAIHWNYLEAEDAWLGFPAISETYTGPQRVETGDETFAMLEGYRLERIAFNTTVELQYGFTSASEIASDVWDVLYDNVVERIYGGEGPQDLSEDSSWLHDDLFEHEASGYEYEAFGFDVQTSFSGGAQQNQPVDFDALGEQILNDGLLVQGGNWGISSVSANDSGFAVELNAAISDGFQPGRSNVISSIASSEVKDVFNTIVPVTQAVAGTIANTLGMAALSYLSGWSRGIAEIDPLILDLDGDGIELTPFNQHYILFDVDNDGSDERTGWVGSDDGILVHDLNGDGEINNITETLSEYYSAVHGTGAIWSSGFDALASLDSNTDGQITAADAVWGDLRIWIDANSNGQTDAGELVTLDAQGVSSLSLADVDDGAFVGGNEVKSNSSFTLADDTSQTLAAVNFIADPNGIAAGTDGSGTRFDLETGGSVYAVGIDTGELVNLATKGVISAMGGSGNDTLQGDGQDNWLVGALGVDQLFGGDGNDYLISDWADIETTQANVDGGSGFDIVQFVGDKGVVFNLQDSQVEMAIGTDHADIMSAGSTDQTIINGGLGDDLLIGGSADDVLNGEEGSDAVYGHEGDDLIRGHRGRDQLIGGEGNDILQGGQDDDELFGGVGEDLLDGGDGDDTLDGGTDYDVAQYTGSYADYRVSYNDDGSITVADQRIDGDGSDTLFNVEALNFADINEVKVNGENPLPVKDALRVSTETDGAYRIAIADLLANDLDYQGDALSLSEAFDAKGGTVAIDGDEIVFTPEAGFTGVPSFSYRVQDAHGNSGVQVGVTGTTQTAEMSAQVKLISEDLPEDPQFIDQWYLPEINVLPVWQDYTGSGVTVGVFEPGPWDAETYGKIDYSHPDLQPNISAEELRTDNPNIEPTQHATLVAGVIAAARNDIGGVGVAYDARLTSKGITEADPNPLLDWANVDVANNSWGGEDLFNELVIDQNGTSLGEAILYDAAANGRDGLGSVVVFAGGNDRQSGHDTNAQDLTNSHYALTVGAVNAEGDLGNLQIAADPFSNPGASILVSAPGSNVTSTSRLIENENGSTFGSDYDAAQGTSLAAPIVSGVVALMLEANPNLGWRDVQEILALSAKQIDDPNTEWETNGASNWNGGGMHFSRDYGYGLVDAHAAARLAETWQSQKTSANEYGILAEVTGFAISDSGSTPDQEAAKFLHSIDIESVEVVLDIDHARMGDLEVTLISPNGTKSVLLYRPGVSESNPHGHGSFDGDWRLTSTHFRGEDSAGTWTLQVHDKVNGETGTINNWELRAFGAESSDNDTYVFTEEFASIADPDRALLDDIAGSDAINTSAVTDAVHLDLRSSGTSLISGRELLLSAQTVIEAAYAGDGDDFIIGNAAANLLSGGRGNDELSGGLGNDTLIGGQGDDILFGGWDNDQFIWYQGDGNDIIRSVGKAPGVAPAAFGLGQDMLVLGDLTSNQVEVSRDGYDVKLRILPTDEVITLEANYLNVAAYHSGDVLSNNPVDIVTFSDGEVWNLQELEMRAFIRGTDSAEILTGTSDNEGFVGGQGDDTLHGYGGDDKFLWAKGDGNDVIKASIIFPSTAAVALGDDRLVLLDVASDDVEVRRMSEDLKLIIVETGETITLSESLITFTDSGEVMNNKPIDHISFSDGIEWSFQTILNQVITVGTDADETIWGLDTDDEIDGGQGDDILTGQLGDDTYIYRHGDGNDHIWDGWGANKLKFVDLNADDITLTTVANNVEIQVNSTGEVIHLERQFLFSANGYGTNPAISTIEFADGSTWNSDRISEAALTMGTDEDDVIDGSSSHGEGILAGLGDDLVNAIHGGNDWIIYRSGDGNDTINADPTDRIIFADLQTTDVSAMRIGDNAEITIQSTDHTITLVDAFVNSTSSGNSLGLNHVTDRASPQIEFANGEITSVWSLLDEPGLSGTDADDYVTSYFAGSRLFGMAGDDYIISEGGSAELFGGPGDDVLMVLAGHNTEGLTATDFHGGAGFDSLYGHHNSADTYFAGATDDAEVIFNTRDASGSLTDKLVLGQGITAADIEWVVFNDDLLLRISNVDYATVPPALLGLIDLFQTDPNLSDQIANLGGVETLYLLANLGGGLDATTLLDVFGISDETTTVIPIEAINEAYDAHFGGLVLNIQIIGWFLNPENQLDKITLSDGTIVEIPEHILALQPDWIIGDDNLDDTLTGSTGAERIDGGSGEDTIDGLSGNDLINGGRDADVLTGGAGADMFVFTLGDGQDTVTDFEDGVDVIEFRATGSDFNSLSIVDSSAGVVVNYNNGDEVMLTGITATQLTVDDFMFN